MEKSKEGIIQQDDGVMVMCETMCENSLHNRPECYIIYIDVIGSLNLFDFFYFFF